MNAQYPWRAFINEESVRDTSFLTINAVIEQIPPCCDVVVRPKKHAQWIVVECPDEATAIVLAMEFNNHFDGHGVMVDGKLDRRSPCIISGEIMERRLKFSAANDS